MKNFFVPMVFFAIVGFGAQSLSQNADSLGNAMTLKGVSVSAKRNLGVIQRNTTENAVQIGQNELFKAACCNLGESFTTNPSVDVTYTDAATGTKQIRLLGLGGIYVGMLSEGLPDFSGAALPYALDFVPGTWIKSISLSKGCASVKTGYSSLAGLMDIEYLRPQDVQSLKVNLYANSMGRTEANVAANMHLSDGLSAEVLLHGNYDFLAHDANYDGFADSPLITNLNFQNRWHFAKNRYIFHGGITALYDNRRSGQRFNSYPNPFLIDIDTRRYGAYMKHAFIINPLHESNVAFVSSFSYNDFYGGFGSKELHSDEKRFYSQLMYETKITLDHELSAGITLEHNAILDHALLRSQPDDFSFLDDFDETLGGAYLQYTFSPSHKLSAMAGVRTDFSSLYGLFLTPRVHVKLAPSDWFTVRLSAGKATLSQRPLAVNHFLLSSGRNIFVDTIVRDKAWNVGLSANFMFKVFSKYLKINLEYYYTHFLSQNIIDYETDRTAIHLTALDGTSYSGTFQIDVSYPLVKDVLEITAAYRLNDVHTTYNGVLMEKPLLSRNKALFTITAKPGLGLWQFDATLQLNGSGRMPTPYLLPNGEQSWPDRFGAYPVLNAQITRWFKKFSLYLGVENITNYSQPDPIINAADPWSSDFEPTLVWGPTQGIMVYAGFRLDI